MNNEGKTFTGCYSQNITKPSVKNAFLKNQLNSLKRIEKESSFDRPEALLELPFFNSVLLKYLISISTDKFC